jgi:hypothetical protein
MTGPIPRLVYSDKEIKLSKQGEEYMFILSRLLRRGAERPVRLQILEESIAHLRLTVFIYLYEKKYLPVFGKEEAAFLAAAVVNTMLHEAPGNEQAKVYYERNKDKIFQEASKISKDKELSGIAGGASYLYAAEILYATAMINNPYLASTTKELYSKVIHVLEEQATLLDIWIPDSYSICGSNDVREWICHIYCFAKDYLDKHAIGKAYS